MKIKGDLLICLNMITFRVQIVWISNTEYINLASWFMFEDYFRNPEHYKCLQRLGEWPSGNLVMLRPTFLRG